jgi:hypothetical protein
VKKPIRESLWLVGLALITVLLIHRAFSDSIKGIFGQIDIQLHDTYFVIDALQVWVFVFFNLAFWVYLLKTSVSGFKNQSSNWILFFVSVLLVLITGWVIRMVGIIESRSSWNIIPPDGLAEGTPVITDFTYWKVNNYLVFYQFLQTLVLAFCGFKIGRQHKNAISTSSFK